MSDDFAPVPPPQPSLESQIGEDFAAIRDICERLQPLVLEGTYSPSLDIICRNLKQCCDQMKFYQYHLPASK